MQLWPNSWSELFWYILNVILMSTKLLIYCDIANDGESHCTISGRGGMFQVHDDGLLDVHNEIRRAVEPPASNMQHLASSHSVKNYYHIYATSHHI